MIKKILKYAQVLFVILAMGTHLHAQSRQEALSKIIDGTLTEDVLLRQVSFLADSVCRGRGTGTAGSCEAAFWICREFERAGLVPLSGQWGYSFHATDKLRGHNVIGMLDGSTSRHPDKYIIVGAHYDNLGYMDGKLFAGADSNASGVVAMTSIAKMMTMLKALGRQLEANIIFVAFDAKTYSMAGSSALWKQLEYRQLTDPVNGHRISVEDISLMVNIDQIGSTLEPVRSRRDFIIMLGNDRLPEDKLITANICNWKYGLNLLISFDYYGSEKFTNIFYRLSDQRVFVDNGIPSIFFTSGITMMTNKTTDTVECIDAEVFRKRITFIFHWLENIIS